MRKTLAISTALFSTFLMTGCTAANPEAVTTLDSSMIVYAHGADDGSQIAVHRQGSLDPDGHQQTVAVTDSRVTLESDGDQIRVETLSLTLGNTDLAPTPQMPEGLKLRAQSLSLSAPVTAQVRERGAQVLALTLDGSMRYATGMELDDGSIYPLGPSEASGELELTVARAADGTLSLRLDSQGTGACAEIGDLLTLSNCALSVETSGVLIEPR